MRKINTQELREAIDDIYEVREETHDALYADDPTVGQLKEATYAARQVFWELSNVSDLLYDMIDQLEIYYEGRNPLEEEDNG